MNEKRALAKEAEILGKCFFRPKPFIYYVRIPDRIRQELFVEACNLVFKAQFAVYGSDDTLHLTHCEHSSEE